MFEYLDFELLIGAASAVGHLVTVVESPAGEGEAFYPFALAEPLQGLTLADTAELLRKHDLTLRDDLMAALHTNTEGNAQSLVLAIDALKRTRTPERLIGRLAEADSIQAMR